MIKDEVVRAMSGLADRWSREAAAIPVPDRGTPGRSIVRTDITAADRDRLDQCAEELRIELARWT